MPQISDLEAISDLLDLDVRPERTTFDVRQTVVALILEFPGVESGKWTDLLTGEFYTCIRYQSYISSFHRGVSCFSWMVQPDGRYWEDDDGFGAESDQEIWLYALMDQKGTFITEFSEHKPAEGEYENYGKSSEKDE